MPIEERRPQQGEKKELRRGNEYRIGKEVMRCETEYEKENLGMKRTKQKEEDKGDREQK